MFPKKIALSPKMIRKLLSAGFIAAMLTLVGVEVLWIRLLIAPIAIWMFLVILRDLVITIEDTCLGAYEAILEAQAEAGGQYTIGPDPTIRAFEQGLSADESPQERASPGRPESLPPAAGQYHNGLD